MNPMIMRLTCVAIAASVRFFSMTNVVAGAENSSNPLVDVVPT